MFDNASAYETETDLVVVVVVVVVVVFVVIVLIHMSFNHFWISECLGQSNPPGKTP